MVNVWTRDPLVALTVIVYIPWGVLCPVATVRVDVEYGPTVDGRDSVGPWRFTGEIVAESVTVPLNPFVPLTVIV
jgi:hypothetical protein